LFGTTFIADPTQCTAHGFNKHIDGETALILSRGPDDAWSSMGRQLLADGRLTLVYLTMQTFDTRILKVIDQCLHVPEKKVTSQPTTVETIAAVAIGDRFAT
jgi:hypothetical protein